MQPLTLPQADDGSLFGLGADKNGLPYFALGSSDGSTAMFLIGGPGLSFIQGLSQAVYTGLVSADGSISGTVDGFSTGLVNGNQDNCAWSGTFLVQTRNMCDINGDGRVDRNDLAMIFVAHNTAAVTGDPRDADGTITVNDVRFCSLRCTDSGCAP